LITGASAGLGEEFAWQLAAAGHDVVLVARNADRLRELAAQIEGATGVSAEVLVADLSDDAATAAVARRLADHERPVSLLVNNAGFGSGLRFLDADIDAQVAGLDVMVRAVLVLSHAAARAMVGRGHGAILNVASVAAYLGSGTYSAHKAWVVSFTEGLALELRGTGVTATAVLPGLTHTEFHARADLSEMEALPEVVWLRAEDVVEAALVAVRRGQVLVTPSLRYAAAVSIARVLPRSLMRRASGRIPGKTR